MWLRKERVVSITYAIGADIIASLTSLGYAHLDELSKRKHLINLLHNHNLVSNDLTRVT